MKIAYYPGCSGQGTSLEYETSTQAVCKALGIELEAISDWSCCGSTPAHACDHVLSAALSARNLQLVANQGLDRMATPCPSCLANLKTAKQRMSKPEFKTQVDRLLDDPTADKLPDTISVLQLLVEDFGLDAIKAKVKKPLAGLKLACYYGCLMSRPAELMQFDNPENPMALDNILTALGAEVVDFPLKTECCGAAMGIPRRDITARLSARLLQTAMNLGADAVVVACPLCHMNLDLRQEQAIKGGHLPIFYYTQLMGLSLGLNANDLGLTKLCISPAEVLQKLQAQDAAPSAKVEPQPAQGEDS